VSAAPDHRRQWQHFSRFRRSDIERRCSTCADRQSIPILPPFCVGQITGVTQFVPVMLCRVSGVHIKGSRNGGPLSFHGLFRIQAPLRPVSRQPSELRTGLRFEPTGQRRIMPTVCTFDWTFAGKHALLWPRRGALGSRSHPDRDWRGFRWCKHRDRRGAEPGALP
jgi:hypothetical protein